MAFYSGNAASAKINQQKITGVQSWSFNINKEVPETTALGSTFKTFQTTTYSGEGTLEILLDEGDNSFQNGIISSSVGTAELIDLELHVTDSDSINMAKALITGVDFGVGVSSIATMTVNFISNSAITFDNLDQA